MQKNNYSFILKNIEKEISLLFNKNNGLYNAKIIDKLVLNRTKTYYKRSSLLIKLLEEFTNPAVIKTQEVLITHFCVIVELLNIANKIHDLIENNITTNAKLSITKGKQLSLDQAILLGDLVFTLTFEQMSIINQEIIYDHFAKTTQDMALYEANLLMYEINHNNKHKTNHQITNEIIELIENKHWPLFNSLLFIFKLINQDSNDSKNQKIKQNLTAYNKEYCLKKILTKKVILKDDLCNYLYQNLNTKPHTNISFNS